MLSNYSLMQTIVLSLLVGLVIGGMFFIVLAEVKRKSAPECDHVFFPAWSIDDPDQLIGQRCAICQHFNPVDEVIPGYTKNYLQRNA